jgi:spore maturation protein CgeB
VSGRGLRLAVFGLTVSSSWGNSHAKMWRGLARALSRLKVSITFFERHASHFADARDGLSFPGIDLVLYDDWAGVEAKAREAVLGADAAIVTSLCPDGPAAADLVRARAPFAIFYDLDTPMTLGALDGPPAPYLPRDGMIGFDLVLSATGGPALDLLARRFGADPVWPLYAGVDPEEYSAEPSARRADVALSYLGTYAPDRQWLLASLFVEAARRLPDRVFLIGGAQYPHDFPWTPNTLFVRHVDPAQHRRFYGAAPLTLNVTRASMARIGYCPTLRLFEAAACETVVVSDIWEGIESFFAPGEEILLAQSVDDVVGAIELGEGELVRMARRARQRVLDEHTAAHRASELMWLMENGASRPVSTIAGLGGAGRLDSGAP